METKRIFVGVFVDKEIFSKHLSLLKDEFDSLTFGKWVEEENIHFTMKFIGDFAVNQIRQLKELIADQLGDYSETLTFRGLATIPERGTPRVLYANIECSNCMLEETADIIDTKLTRLGIEPEKRAFLPHITLLRLKSSSQGFRTIVQKHKDTTFGEMRGYRVSLIESKLTSRGPIYKII